MKNKILLLSLLIGSIGAHEIPSFQSLCQAGYVGCTKELIPFYVMRNHLLFNDQMAIEQIEPTLVEWYNQNPELYNLTLQSESRTLPEDVPNDQAFDFIKKIEDHLLPFTLVDAGALQLQISSYRSKDNKTPIDLLKRCEEIVRVLKKLGVKQTLSDEQIDLIAQLFDIVTHSRGNVDEAQALFLLEKLLGTYENVIQNVC